MQSKSKRAEELYLEGFNCAQSVLAAFSEEYDLETEAALMLSSPLGGGCGLAEICGAALGGAMVVGLKHGHHIADDTGTNMNCRAKRGQFIDEFKKLNGAITCRELLGFDHTTEEGQEKYVQMAKDRPASPCAGFVRESARILEQLEY